jgi:uncharacterized protein (DUF779 family)
MFAQMVRQMEPLRACAPFAITRDQYNIWKSKYIFEAIKGREYGMCFCQDFGIVDYILRFSTSMIEADVYIQRTYIK